MTSATVAQNANARRPRRRKGGSPARGSDEAAKRPPPRTGPVTNPINATARPAPSADAATSPGAAHLERVAAHHVQVRADGRREVDLVDDEGSLFAASAGPSGLPPFLRQGRLAFAFCAAVALLNARLAASLPPWPAARGRAWRRQRLGG